jgi:hypothetical protein
VGAREHAGELEPLDAGPDRRDVAGDLGDSGRVTLVFGQRQQFGGVSQRAFDAGDVVDDDLELGALAAQGLGALGVVPRSWILQGFLNLGQPPLLRIEVKDTP